MRATMQGSRNLHRHIITPVSRAPIKARPLTSTTATALMEAQSERVAIITTLACPYCKAAKERLFQAGIAYSEVDVSVGSEAFRERLREVCVSKTVPQIFVGGQCIGGSDALAEMMENGSFQALLDSNPHGPALPPELREGARQNQEDSAKRIRIHQKSDMRILADQMSAQGGVSRKELVLREDATKLARMLLDTNLISPVELSSNNVPYLDSGDASYFLVSEAPPPNPGQSLNTHFLWRGAARPALQVSRDLRELILSLYERHLSVDGRAVDYKQLGKDEMFKRYIDTAAELQKVDISPLSTPELTVLFINLYNALIVHATVVLGPASNLAQRVRFFASAKYTIGGLEYSADDMENGVLRGNRPAASNLWAVIGLPQFSGGQFPNKGDPRRSKVVENVDPRIHFALVCGAKSCPPIKLYTPENLNEGLDSAGEAFCSGEVQVSLDKRQVVLSKIFKWYANDFGQTTVERLQWILPFLKGAAQDDLAAMLGDGGRDIHIVYKEYDWGLNDVS